MFRPMLRPLVVRSLPTWARWAIAVLLVVASFLVRYSLFGQSTTLPYLLFFPAICASAVMLDRGAGFVAALLSALLALFNFVEPVGSLTLNGEAAISVGLFLAVSLFIAVVSESLHVSFVETAEARRVADEARRSAEQARSRAESGEQERELLLREFGHRVKNDLARIAATMGLQASSASPEVAAALNAAADRVRVISRVHDRLARQEGKVLVDVHDLLHDMVLDLRTSLVDPTPVRLSLDTERHHLSVSRTGAVGLIANELVTNALKHAFPDERGGEVRIGFRRDGAEYELTVEDDGVGIAEPDGMAPGSSRGGLGQRLVRALATQLGGRVQTSRSGTAGGTVHTLRFPVTPSADENGL
jgi:two-component system, sensor histidine kinase PdtaS